MVYGDTPAAGCWALLPVEVRSRFEAVAARMADIMALDGGVGLIHADLHLGNALFHRGRVKLIDFDDCGTGPRLYELAVALWELRERSDYPAFRDALLAGYRAHREVDVTHLDDFIAVRQVAFDLWYTGTAQVKNAKGAVSGTIEVRLRRVTPQFDKTAMETALKEGASDIHVEPDETY